MKYDIHYGAGQISLDIPRGNISEFICPCSNTSQLDNSELVVAAISRPDNDAVPRLGMDNFRNAIKNKCLCIMLSDGTRDMPIADVFAHLLPNLANALAVKFIICTGTHNPETPENSELIEQIKTLTADANLSETSIDIHDCRKDGFINAGTTSRGTEVLYNPAIADADVFLVLSDVKSHYFAGYSNPVKYFLPGICSYRTAEQNHSLALDPVSTFGTHPWHTDSNKRTNPLAADQLEGMKLITGDRKVFAFVTISTSGKIQWARFGNAEETTAAAFDESDRQNSRTVKPVDRLIVSPGGLPNDVDLYIAQRALELTSAAVNDGGEVLFIAACPKGVGETHTRKNFYDCLTKPIPEILKSIEQDYALFSHKPYKFAMMIESLRRLWVYSEIPEEMITAAHLDPTDNPQKIVDTWLTENPETKITIVDGANKIALHADPETV